MYCKGSLLFNMQGNKTLSSSVSGKWSGALLSVEVIGVLSTTTPTTIRERETSKYRFIKQNVTSFLFLHGYDVKMPNFHFMEDVNKCTQGWQNFLSLSKLEWVPKKSTPAKFAYIADIFMRIGIYTYMYSTFYIHFTIKWGFCLHKCHCYTDDAKTPAKKLFLNWELIGSNIEGDVFLQN